MKLSYSGGVIFSDGVEADFLQFNSSSSVIREGGSPTRPTSGGVKLGKFARP
jgi:hypothetical protein